MAVLRVFTAITLPDSLVQKIDSAIKRHLIDPALRTVERNALHVTLNFIGDVEDRETPELCRAFKTSLTGIGPFEVKLKGMGAFPNFDRPRVLWIGVDDGSDAMVAINQRLRDVIEEFGFVQEKRYLPHLTVARVQSRHLERSTLQRVQNEFERLKWNRFGVSNVVVFNSLLEKGGPTYIPLATLPLQED